MSVGKVFLVGAGPGDGELLTLKAARVLAQAETVIYDSLVGEEVLAQIPKSARCIFAGKRLGAHAMPQEKIQELLVEEAKKGRQVVRLKGGDPFLFGRGGEEAEALTKEGIPWEAVPGITSALAVPAYHGIAVTHRELASSVHIITGHKKQGAVEEIDFQALVSLGGTCVFLMGVSALGEICRGFLKAGMDPKMPAAVLQKGTTAAQKSVTATISTLEEEAARQGVEMPAVIVVGQVCSLSKRLSWYEQLPLSGCKVLVTRPAEQSREITEKLKKLGCEVLAIPSIRTEAMRDQSLLYQAFGRLASYQWIVFTSPAGVRVFFDEMKKTGTDARRLGQVRMAVIGKGTRKALEERGFFADLMPDVFDGAHLGKALCLACRGTERILLPRAREGGREILEALMEKPGLQVEDVPIYETFYEEQGLIDVKKDFQQGEIFCAVFTSASTVKGFVHATPGLDYRKVRAACIGFQTMEAARRYKMECYRAEEASVDSLVELVLRLREEQAEKREE